MKDTINTLKDNITTLELLENPDETVDLLKDIWKEVDTVELKCRTIRSYAYATGLLDIRAQHDVHLACDALYLSTKMLKLALVDQKALIEVEQEQVREGTYKPLQKLEVKKEVR
jgi:hypothetical protein